MSTSTEETERPTEWLRSLQEGRRAYRWLVEDAGSLALAAYRLARARCRVQPVPTLIPTVTELGAAARRIQAATGSPALCLVLLIDECEAAGLPVIAPISRDAA